MKTLRDNAIWKAAFNIAVRMYEQADEMSSSIPNEKWNTERKIRNSANDMLFYVAEAVANPTIDTTEYDWSSARKHIFGLQTMYIFASKKHFLELEPDLIVEIDKLIVEIDKGIEKSKKEVKRKTKEEMDRWLERYRLWKVMNDDSSGTKK